MNLEGSKTYIGLAIAFAPSVATVFGYETSPNFEGDATELLSALVQLIGTAIAVYGRFVAKGPTLLKKKSF